MSDSYRHVQLHARTMTHDFFSVGSRQLTPVSCGSWRVSAGSRGARQNRDVRFVVASVVVHAVLLAWLAWPRAVVVTEVPARVAREPAPMAVEVIAMAGGGGSSGAASRAGS